MKIPEKKLPGAEIFGITVIVDESLDQYSSKILFPRQYEAMMKLLSMVDDWDEFLDRKPKK